MKAFRKASIEAMGLGKRREFFPAVWAQEIGTRKKEASGLISRPRGLRKISERARATCQGFHGVHDFNDAVSNSFENFCFKAASAISAAMAGFLI